MPIHKRISTVKPKKLPYHALFGSFKNPPFTPQDKGCGADPWPNGATVTTRKLPRHQSHDIILGWCVRRGLNESQDGLVYGVWLPTKIGWSVSRNGMLSFNLINPWTDFEYLGEKDGIVAVLTDLREAFEEKHEVFLL
jgi:hypothetical protein